MIRKAVPIKLSTGDLRSLKTVLRRGITAARVQTRARALDLLHRGPHPNSIAATLSLSLPTVYRIKRRYLNEGLQSALYDKPRSGTPRRIDEEVRAKITALACSEPPEGHARWTLRLLADPSIKLGFVKTISHSGVKKILKKTDYDRA